MATIESWFKDPDARLDYAFDWSSWMVTGDSITAHQISITSLATGDPLVADASSVISDTVVVWLSGGKLNSRYSVACRITTAEGRIDERTRIVRITKK